MDQSTQFIAEIPVRFQRILEIAWMYKFIIHCRQIFYNL